MVDKQLTRPYRWISATTVSSGKPRDHKDAAQDIARDLADIAGQLASLKGEANAWLRDTNYDTLKLRLVSTHAADSRLPLCGG